METTPFAISLFYTKKVLERHENVALFGIILLLLVSYIHKEKRISTALPRDHAFGKKLLM